MSEKQSKIDSWMEAICNTAAGFVVSLIANALILPALFGIHLSMSANITCSLLYTGVSILRQYTLRRMFNGRSIWESLKCRTSS